MTSSETRDHLTTQTMAPVVPARANQTAFGALTPLGIDQVRLDGGFWGDRQERNQAVTFAHIEHWLERVGWLGNFDAVANSQPALTSGVHFVDSEVYKLLEGMAWELGRAHTDELQARYDAIVRRVNAAQRPDGYLNTQFGNPTQQPRFSDLEWGHELYCAGHLFQAAVARIRTGYDDALVGIARRFADYLVREFLDGGRPGICGHPEVEVGLAELARATAEDSYLALAREFVNRRGHGLLGPIEFGAEYFQDDVPVRDATVWRGHAVRALYLSAGALDIAADDQDVALQQAIDAQWKETLAKRTYLTGGMGSHHQDEAFGADYELPSDRAYAESCAGIASNMVSWRLLLATGRVEFADLMERTLYNVIATSTRHDGAAFFYTNTLHQRTAGDPTVEGELSQRALSSQRAPWFHVSCCPTNLARTLSSLGGYAATQSEQGLQLWQYFAGDIAVDHGGERLAVNVATQYPHQETITITIQDAPASEVTLSLRIPPWARGGASVTGSWNGETVGGIGDEMYSITRTFAAGDNIRLVVPLEVRVVTADPRVDAVRGQFALERGPLVLCVESVDLGDDVGEFEAHRDGVIALDGDPVDAAWGASVEFSRRGSLARDSVPLPYATAPSTGAADGQDRAVVSVLPHCDWGNRGPSTMRVWLPRAEDAAATASAHS